MKRKEYFLKRPTYFAAWFKLLLFSARLEGNGNSEKNLHAPTLCETAAAAAAAKAAGIVWVCMGNHGSSLRTAPSELQGVDVQTGDLPPVLDGGHTRRYAALR